MPELPEVQTVVNHLAQRLIGKVFSACQIKVAKMVNRGFAVAIKNRRVLAVKRRAKIIIMELSGGFYLLVHLKMTGQLIFVDKQGKVAGGGHPINSKDFDLAKPNKFTQIILKFKDGSQLLFHDMRKFGWMKIVSRQQLAKIADQYGVEPLSEDFTLKKFIELFKKRPNLKIKQWLMNQELIAGIGNIYADESLFLAKISPFRPVKSLKPLEIKVLHQAIISKLKQAISLGGTSVNTFVNPSDERGQFVEKLKVYGRAKEKCLRCKSILQGIKVGGRGTVFCEKCQK